MLKVSNNRWVVPINQYLFLWILILRMLKSDSCRRASSMPFVIHLTSTTNGGKVKFIIDSILIAALAQNCIWESRAESWELRAERCLKSNWNWNGNGSGNGSQTKHDSLVCPQAAIDFINDTHTHSSLQLLWIARAQLLFNFKIQFFQPKYFL